MVLAHEKQGRLQHKNMKLKRPIEAPQRSTQNLLLLQKIASLSWSCTKWFVCWVSLKDCSLFCFLVNGSCCKTTFSVQQISFFRKTFNMISDNILTTNLGRCRLDRLQDGQKPGWIFRLRGQQWTVGNQAVTSGIPQGLIFKPKQFNTVTFDLHNQ